MDIISRQEAKGKGLTRYFTGNSCRRGHLSERYVITCHCCICDIEVGKKFYTQHPERCSAYTKKYRSFEKNQQRQAHYHSDWRQQNPDKMKANGEAWRTKNPLSLALKEARRRAKKFGSREHYTADDIAKIFKMQKGKCAYCRIKIPWRKWHIDHIKPLSAGGSDGRFNIQILCKPCNLRKGARDPLEFSQSQGMLL